MSALRILVGADPELFLKNPKTGKYVSAHDILPGTKYEPFDIHSEGAEGAIQVDGTAAEFNIDPASTSLSFITRVEQVLTNIKGRVKGLELAFDPVVEFDSDYFKMLPSSAVELGCNPDWNAYTGEVNPAPDGASTTMRTASGHIHIGWCKNVNPFSPMHFEDCITVVKQLDYFLGLYSLLWDPDSRRRELYGKAGAFRPKPYGVEYRTMSNVWLRSPTVQAWIFNSTITALETITSKGRKLFDIYGDFAKDAINSNQTTWFKTEKGRTIHTETGLMWPDSRSCMPPVSEKEEKKEAEVKKLKAKHIYGDFKFKIN